MRRLLPLLCWFAFANVGFAQGSLPLKDGDRVVLLGNGFIGGEREHGYLEARWSRHSPEAKVIFRNLGWPGDNVLGAARTGGFKNPGGIDRLVKEVRDLKPTILVIGYGMNESFDGPEGLPAFVKGYKQLLDKLAPLKAKVIVLSPSHHEDLGRPWLDPKEHNADLEKYTRAIAELASTEKAHFIEVVRWLPALGDGQRLTTNGIQLNDAGYRVLAEIFEARLGLPDFPGPLEFGTSGKVRAIEGRTIVEAKFLEGNMRLRVRDAFVPVPGERLRLRVGGLKAGDYAVRIDGKEVTLASDTQLANGINIVSGSPFTQGADLCRKIVAKNEFFYHRWRPFNDHSRHWGFIGKDFDLWEQQVARQEQLIAQARRPVPYTIEILREVK